MNLINKMNSQPTLLNIHVSFAYKYSHKFLFFLASFIDFNLVAGLLLVLLLVK